MEVYEPDAERETQATVTTGIRKGTIRMSALASITAKYLMLEDAVWSFFVTVSSRSSASNCGINVVSGSMTDCGAELAEVILGFALALINVVHDILPALGVV